MLEITDNDWIYAGNTGNILRKKGIAVPIADLIIFSAADKNSCALYTLDKHFEIIKSAIASGMEILSL